MPDRAPKTKRDTSKGPATPDALERATGPVPIVEFEASIAAVSRRSVHLHLDNQIRRLPLLGRYPRLLVGDRVICKHQAEDLIIVDVLPRKNCLYRTFGRKEKPIAANLDHLLIVCAPPPLFNTVFLDQSLAAAKNEGIDCTLVLNKFDLDVSQTLPLLEVYEQINCQILCVSARTGKNMELLGDMLQQKDLTAVALAGVSGVGKSTLLNVLVPKAMRPTREVSERTGHGRQTTSLAFGYLFGGEDSEHCLLIDLPGIQDFGVSHLSKEDIIDAFPEIRAVSELCRFNNCNHTIEPGCMVIDAVEAGIISLSRYESYLRMRGRSFFS